MVEFKLPELGEGVTTGTVVKVLIKPGEFVKPEQAVIEIETDKAVLEVPSSVAGRVVEVRVKEGEKARVGEVLFTVDGADAAGKMPALATPPSERTTTPSARTAPKTTAASPAPSPAESDANIPAAPAARREAREIGVDLAHVGGSGPRGRITVEDVRRAAREMRGGRTTANAEDTALERQQTLALPDFSKWGAIERKEMSTVRRLTAERMALAWHTIPHVTQFDKVDVTVLDELRERFAKRAEDAGGKLTLTVILLKLVASALRVFPQFNASVDMGKSEIVYKKYIHIGVAVDTDRGLIVPVIRDADKKNIIELSIELHRAADRARQHKTTREEMQGASFTVTNLGGIGGAYFTPIIIPPEVAILGVSRSAKEPYEKDGKIVFRNMMPLSLSYDHRVIDGADAVRFLRWIANATQDSFLMGLEG